MWSFIQCHENKRKILSFTVFEEYLLKITKISNIPWAVHYYTSRLFFPSMIWLRCTIRRNLYLSWRQSFHHAPMLFCTIFLTFSKRKRNQKPIWQFALSTHNFMMHFWHWSNFPSWIARLAAMGLHSWFTAFGSNNFPSLFAENVLWSWLSFVVRLETTVDLPAASLTCMVLRRVPAEWYQSKPRWFYPGTWRGERARHSPNVASLVYAGAGWGYESLALYLCTACPRTCWVLTLGPCPGSKNRRKNATQCNPQITVVNVSI